MADRDDASSLIQGYARLLSLAVHEFRTPASVVSGYLRMLQRDTDHPMSDRQRKMVDEAEKSCGRLVALINELSEVSKLDAGTAAVKEETADLFQLMREVAEGVHEAEDRGVRLQVRGEANGAPIRGDITRLRVAFSAFLQAILREQPARATVVAECRRDKQREASSAVFVVAPDTDVQRSYEAEPAAFDDKRGGLGLALAIACRVIERHGGRVWSPKPDGSRGGPGQTAVLISLPLGKAHS
jgi:signal transduction histidine kinase